MFGILVVVLLVFVGIMPSYADGYWKIYHLNATVSYPESPHIVEYKIPYKITNGTLESMNFQWDTIFILLKNYGSGVLEITIPRNLSDPDVFKNEKSDFLVQINGQTVTFQESKLPCFRTIAIKFDSNAKEIDVIGSAFLSGEGPVRVYVPPVYLTSNKTSVNSQQTITISGCTDLKLDYKNVIINIINPQGQTYKTMSVSPDINGSFSTSVLLEGSSASNTVYTVNATYAGHTTTGTVTVPEFPASSVIIVAIAALLLTVRILPSKLKL